MFIFTKMTQIPVKINNKNPKLASYILSQYGGPDGELGASLRYLSQRFAQTDKSGIALLTDIGTEELGHLEMVGSIVTQLTKGEGAKSFDRYGVGDYYIDHANGVYPSSASGVPFSAAYLQSKADPIADIMEDMAAEGNTTKYIPLKIPKDLNVYFTAIFGSWMNNDLVNKCLDNFKVKIGHIKIFLSNLHFCLIGFNDFS